MIEDHFEIKFNTELSVQSGPIRVICYELSDRVGHSIFLLVDDGKPIEFMRSMEGDDVTDLPPSGPMQEIVSETASIGKEPVLMGLGSAGKSTWSCSIEGDATIESIAFDFACKTRATERLGSTYHLLNSAELIRSENKVVVFAVAGIEVCLRVFGEALLRVETNKRLVSIDAPLPANDLPASQKAQRRWRYVVGLASSLVFASDQADT